MMGGQMNMYPGSMNPPNVQPVQFASLQMQQSAPESGNIGLIMDVFMEMTVELGRTKKAIKEILGMGEGTIIELDKLAGEPVDILVNHKLIAKGEVVVIDENFGVRVTEIVSPMERMSDLG
jgi:flagellar motor switch protein FliN/FliY